MSPLSLESPLTWFVFLEVATYLCCGVIILNSVFTERTPKLVSTLVTTLIMLAAMVPTVLIDSPLTACVQLFLLVALFFLYSRLRMPGKMSGHLFWATVLVSSGVVITLGIFSLFLSVGEAFKLSAELLQYGAILLVIATHCLITLVLVRTRVIRHEESASGVLYFIVAFWFCACMFVLIALSNETSILQTVVFLKSLEAAGTSVGMAFVNVAIVVTLVFELVYTQWVVRHDRQRFEESYAQISQGFSNNLDTVATELRGLRHDLRNHLIALSGLVHKKDLGEIEAYLGRMLETVEATDMLVLTGNETIDILVSTKLARAQQKGIPVHTRTSGVEALPTDNYSIATIIGNLLDNALEASELLMQQGGEPGIFITIKQQRENCLIQIENNAFAPRRQQETYLSSKSEPSHGLGLIQVQRLVNDANGHVDTSFSPQALLSQRYPTELNEQLIGEPCEQLIGEPSAPQAAKPSEQSIMDNRESQAAKPRGQQAALSQPVGIFTATVLLPTLSR